LNLRQLALDLVARSRRLVEPRPTTEAPAGEERTSDAGGRLDRFDLAVAVGLGLVLAGMWQIHPPTTLILAGLALVRVGIRNG
jgi:hypothetical protein